MPLSHVTQEFLTSMAVMDISKIVSVLTHVAGFAVQPREK